MSSPEIWGPHAWKILHTIAHTYPEKANYETQINIEKFISSFTELLPCEKCKIDFKKYLKKYPIKSSSRDSLVMWMVDAHNSVNKKLNKKLFTYEDAEALWGNDAVCKTCNGNNAEKQPFSRLSSFLKIIQTFCFIMFFVFLIAWLNNKYKLYDLIKKKLPMGTKIK
jgi:hypothetical protein